MEVSPELHFLTDVISSYIDEVLELFNEITLEPAISITSKSSMRVR